MDAIRHHRWVAAPTTQPLLTFWGWLLPGEPHATRGPFTRWPRTTDGVLAVAVFVGSLVSVSASALGEDFGIRSVANQPTAAVALLAGAAGSLLWRRARPVAVAIVVMATMVAWAVAGYGDGQDLALFAACYAVGRYTADPRLSLATAAAASAVSLLGTIIDVHQRVDIAPALLLTALPWYAGRRVRNRGDYLLLLNERADRLEADQHAEARQAVADERSRIARELHDVVAHQVSMITVQAGAAKTIARDDLDAAIGAMTEVEQIGRQTLVELRHLLGVLRTDSPSSDDLGPQPGLMDVTALADELSGTGATVSLTMDPHPGGLAAAVELSAYRIVQESLTNIIRHAGPDPIVDVNIDIGDSILGITVTNTISDAEVPRLPQSGYGIVGMRERAATLGGTLTATREAPDLFRVSATLPLGRDRS